MFITFFYSLIRVLKKLYDWQCLKFKKEYVIRGVHEIGEKEIEGRNKWKRENLINTTEIWRKREYKWDEKKQFNI